MRELLCARTGVRVLARPGRSRALELHAFVLPVVVPRGVLGDHPAVISVDLGACDAKVRIDVLPHRVAVGFAVGHLGVHAKALHLRFERRAVRFRVLTHQADLHGDVFGRGRHHLCRKVIVHGLQLGWRRALVAAISLVVVVIVHQTELCLFLTHDHRHGRPSPQGSRAGKGGFAKRIYVSETCLKISSSSKPSDHNFPAQTRRAIMRQRSFQVQSWVSVVRHARNETACAHSCWRPFVVPPSLCCVWTVRTTHACSFLLPWPTPGACQATG